MKIILIDDKEIDKGNIYELFQALCLRRKYLKRQKGNWNKDALTRTEFMIRMIWDGVSCSKTVKEASYGTRKEPQSPFEKVKK